MTNIQMVVRFKIGGSAEGVYHPEIGFHPPGLREAAQIFLKLIHRGTDPQGAIHHNSFAVHLFRGHVIVLEIIRRCIHDTKTGIVHARPHFSLVTVTVCQADKTIFRSLEPFNPVIQLTGIPVFQHHRTSQSACACRKNRRRACIPVGSGTESHETDEQK